MEEMINLLKKQSYNQGFLDCYNIMQSDPAKVQKLVEGATISQITLEELLLEPRVMGLC